MSKCPTLTHVGLMRYCDSRSPHGYTQRVLLRETKLYWITSGGTKFRKEDGVLAGKTCPMYDLDLSTIKALYE
jgi:hypothetical protein